MKLYFYGDIQGLGEGIDIFSKDLCFECSKEGIPVKVVRTDGNISISMNGGKGCIKYNKKIHFFRALGLLIEAFRGSSSFEIEEKPQFTMNGIMADVSRNAVMTVDTIKYLLKKMAIMGLDMMMLYCEDTYEIKSQPYFGYMRGRYTKEELSDCDDYADILGIEIIPCIQTLAHLFEAIKWNYANDIKDTKDILLTGYDKTYEFIEEMIKSASAPFRSKRIHIGMDEAHNLGLGKYLDINGYKRRFDIMNEHLTRVKEIAYRNGLKPMIWSDMYFRLGSKTGNYYDENPNIPQDIIDSIPKDTQLVYWDYYHNDEDEYRKFIRKHISMGCDILFAGGIWIWNGIVVNYRKTFVSTNAGLSACKKENIKEVFATMWGDNGAETNILSALLGLQLYAEHGYAESLDIEKLKSRFKFCTGEDYDSFIDLSSMDDVPGTEKEEIMAPSNPSKYLLWQDVLIGLLDKHAEGKGLNRYYAGLEKTLKKDAENANTLRMVFDMPAALAAVLALKSEAGINLKRAYDSKDKEELGRLAQEVLPELGKKIETLRYEHRKQWLKTYKPFGWEVIDMRYGGLLARIETAAFRIKQYIDGEVERIEELEEERLYFDGPERPKGIIYGRLNLYHRIVTASATGIEN